MKIKKIEIKNLRQFNDFTLDLTYPIGHKKEGEPLDRVCLIGQSGTGKSSILKFIRWLWNDTNINIPRNENIATPTDKEFVVFQEGSAIKFDIKLKNLHYSRVFESQSISTYGNSKIGGKPISGVDLDTTIKKYLSELEIVGIHYPAEMILNIDKEDPYPRDNKNQIIDFSYEAFEIILESLISKIEKYNFQKNSFKYKNADKVYDGEDIDLRKELKNWKAVNPDPSEDLTKNFLNKLLKHFHLKTIARSSLTKFDKLLFHHSLKKTRWTFNQLSTGIKQIIISSIPLYLYKPENAIILFDEPERSLYPDIQTILINHFFDNAPKCQLFFATHSPIVASCFDPWEIVELKFDEKGDVYQELYFDSNKGRNIESYKLFPKYLRWDSILTKVFDLINDGNPERTKKLVELATIEGKLKTIKESVNKNASEQKDLWDEYQKLANQLNWQLGS